MAAGEPSLTVALTESASEELRSIWQYNAATYGGDHADRYEAFLRERIDSLATDYSEGRSIDGRPGLRQIVMRRGRRGHGHIAVYRVLATTVEILHVFHTAQNLLGRLREEG